MTHLPLIFPSFWWRKNQDMAGYASEVAGKAVNKMKNFALQRPPGTGHGFTGGFFSGHGEVTNGLFFRHESIKDLPSGKLT